MPWKEFIRSHQETLASVDFFTAEVWTAAGLTTYYVLVFTRIAPRQIHVAGITLAPTEEWMKQIARNLTMARRRLSERLSTSAARPGYQV